MGPVVGEDVKWVLNHLTRSATQTLNGSYILDVIVGDGPVHFFYNPSFSTYFFNRNNIFLLQQISPNGISSCFFSEANGPV